MQLSKDTQIAIIGLGYVGLPLAIALGGKFQTIGFDSATKKIESYKSHHDATGQVSEEEFVTAKLLVFTDNPEQINDADVIIIAVPTPVDLAHKPDLRALIAASRVVGENMKSGVLVIYESTVYPGATEEVCVPVLESSSGMKWREDFNVGYSPERVNPGDKNRTLTKIKKVVAADSPNSVRTVREIYNSIIDPEIFVASSIKVAEAAKVIENTQRDLNIALINEFAMIFNKLSIDTEEVLQAAGTKWNFLPFRPGLVGGHCIGVDPYYLTYKAEMVNYHPQVILAGRRINDGMASYIAQETIKKIAHIDKPIKNARIVVLGVTFKENCPDIRNSKVIDLVKELQQFGCIVDVHDPIADPEELLQDCGLRLVNWKELPLADVIIAAVSHDDYLEMSLEVLLERLIPRGIFMDIKSKYSIDAVVNRGFEVWRL